MPPIARTCTALTIACAILGALAASASATKVLTLYANGEPLTLGNRETLPFEIKSTAPFTLTAPSTGEVITCTPKTSWSLRGYLTSNGEATDKIRLLSEGEFSEIRHCSSTAGTKTVAGPQLAGKLELKANGEGSLNALPHIRPAFDMVVNACSYKTTTLPAFPTYGGPLELSLKGTFESEEASCPPVVFESNSYAAIWELGPLVEAFVS